MTNMNIASMKGNKNAVMHLVQKLFNG